MKLCIHTHIHIHTTHTYFLYANNLKIIKTFLSLTWTISIILHGCHYSFQLNTNPLTITLPSWATTIFLCCPLHSRSPPVVFINHINDDFPLHSLLLPSSRSLMASIVLIWWSVSVFITPDPWAAPSILEYVLLVSGIPALPVFLLLCWQIHLSLLYWFCLNSFPSYCWVSQDSLLELLLQCVFISPGFKDHVCSS